MTKKRDIFTRFTGRTSAVLGHAWVFVVALGFLVVWAGSGPLFHYSDTWQLIINTSTTIITFLMVFVIQNTQNRDNMAMNIKLDTILKKLQITEKDLLDAEDMSDKVLEDKKEFMQRRKKRKPSKK